MKKIRRFAVLALVMCLLAAMLPPMFFATAVADEKGEAVLTDIKIVILPGKTEYWVGDTLDTTGLTLLASYSDGNEVEISEGFTVSGFNSEVAGAQTLTVTYKGLSDSFTVTVKQPEMTGISIVIWPRKTEYWVGDTLDTTGLTLLASYSDGNEVEISEGFTVSGFNSEVAGAQTLTVTYKGLSDSFTVTVKQPEMTGISIIIWPRKTEYWVGDTLDTTGLTLLASYCDDSTEEISEGFTVSGFNSEVAGAQTLTVTYKGLSDSFTVTVKQPEVIGIEVFSPPVKTVYWTGEELDTAGLVLLATYQGGTTSQITEGFAVTGFDSTLAGLKTVTISYGDVYVEFTVTVNKLEVMSIEVVSPPEKREYWVGEELDTTGLMLEVVFSDGRIQRITEGFTISGFNSATAGQKTVSVYYQDNQDMFAVFSVTVKTPKVSAVKIKTLPYKTEYFVGEELDLTGLTLTATFSDGSTGTVSSGFGFLGFSSTTPGEKTVTVYYTTLIKYVKITVTVKERCNHTDVENGICTQCNETITTRVTDDSGNLIGNYVDIADALDGAVSGSTLVLLSDTAAKDLILPMCVHLDLNGCVLTVESVLTYGNSLITDSSPKNTGVLKITESDGNMISPNNSCLPVYNSAKDGYRFFSVTVTSKAVTGKHKYWFQVEVANFEEFYPLIRSGAQVQFQVKMTWDRQEKDTYAVADLAFTEAWAERYKANEDIYITVSTAEAEGRENFKLIPGITSGGVEVFGEEM